MNEKTTIGVISGGRVTGLLLAAFKYAGEWPAENETIIVVAYRS
jgi:hypothetical protein